MKNGRLIGLSLVFVAAIGAPSTQQTGGFAGSQQAAHPVATVTVDAAQIFQKIDGFGSSQRVWTDRHVADSSVFPPEIPSAVQSAILTDLYTILGLTRVRTTGVGFVTEPIKGKFVFDCEAIKGCGVDARISYVKQALRHGLATIVSENNPMSWMDGSNPEDYVENTLALLLHWRAMGVEPQYQTLMNEPAATKTPWADALWHLRVVKALGPRVQAAGLKTMLVIPDDLNACTAYPIANTVLEDPQARQYVGALAYHLYGGRARCLQDMHDLSQRYHIPVWMTEHARGPGYDASLEWAREIHNLVASYGVSAVDIMWGFFGDWVIGRFHEEDLIQITFTSDARYISHRRTSNYYITGQFSRFVRPGYMRMGASSTTDAILTTAYRGDQKLVIVVINAGDSDQAVEFVVRRVPMPRSFLLVRTSHDETWKESQLAVPTATALRITLPARSVTTLVGTIQ